MFLTVQRLSWGCTTVSDSSEIVLRMYCKWQFGDCLEDVPDNVEIVLALSTTVQRLPSQYGNLRDGDLYSVENCFTMRRLIWFLVILNWKYIWKFTKICKTPTSILWSNSWDCSSFKKGKYVYCLFFWETDIKSYFFTVAYLRCKSGHTGPTCTTLKKSLIFKRLTLDTV